MPHFADISLKSVQEGYTHVHISWVQVELWFKMVFKTEYLKKKKAKKKESNRVRNEAKMGSLSTK